ncbi:sugar diacid recognition domain-containing protein [Peptococcaceae bacterium 1198_IL3148]
MSTKGLIPIELANKMVQILHKVTGNHVQFMGKNGLIVASTQENRIGTIHEGAKKVMAGEIEFAAITETDAQNIPGVLPGYTGPIKFNGKIIACIGITGNPTIVKPLQELAAIIVTEEIKKEIENKMREELIENISNECSKYLQLRNDD